MEMPNPDPKVLSRKAELIDRLQQDVALSCN